MDYKAKIDKKIKEVFSTQKSFMRHIGMSPENYTNKITAVINSINRVNAFVKPLGFKIELVENGTR